jgi:hypothetical protein
MQGNIEGNVIKAIYLDTRNMTFDSCFVIRRSSQTRSKVCAEYDTFVLASLSRTARQLRLFV